MNAVNMAKTAYSSSSRTPIRTPRSTEYEVFAHVTHQIRLASADESASKFSKLAMALHENRRFWTLLAADVASENNGLPNALRARIFYLAEFTADHSRKVLSENEDPNVLVEINTAVMRGLRQASEAA